MKYFSFLFLLIISISSCNDEGTVIVVEGPYKSPLRGMDISFLPEMESLNTKFYDSTGVEKPFLNIIKESGVNLVRIRLWNNPMNGHSGINEVVTLSNRCKQMGFKILLDLHYSDTWADPANQQPPAAWKELNLAQLEDSVYQFTKDVMHEVQPEYVQIGNEINNGFMWPLGSIFYEEQFATLLKSGVKACREVAPQSKIMIHYAGIEGSEIFYKKLKDHQLDYDIIALSYYPLWHGKSTSVLEKQMDTLRWKFQKDVFIAEFSYPFTLQYNDQTHNVLGQESQLVNGFAATRVGQKAFVSEIRNISNRIFGLGFCYWGGEWVAFKGSASTTGSSYENQALFNFENQANPALGEFRGAD